jgi:hypothetical protein
MRIRSSEASTPRATEAPSADGPSHPPRDPSAGPSPFAKVLSRLGGEIDRGEATVQAALHGAKTDDPAALLALQAGIYRYVEAVDLAAKLVDRAAGAVKTTLQSQLRVHASPCHTTQTSCPRPRLSRANASSSP